MFNLSWFSSKKEASPTWDSATATVQNQQPTSPDAPSTERVVTEQPNSQDNMVKLRGGGAGDVCCGLHSTITTKCNATKFPSTYLSF
ncbi:hypothetical protein N7478_013120 [Penicillium angulare]|uniref:uncharacterized protein n=1 Tax=Penicillium angulare TaxID=116970 RepID=UPI002540D349|nr:uncharacterized protein N7478_013120 [Penicillium angulare]KAJ5257016.1 hypothetical protein N7478_013120 [Penicillium angulare]